MLLKLLCLILLISLARSDDVPFTDVTTLGAPYRFLNASFVDSWTYFRLNLSILPPLNNTDSVSFVVTSLTGDVDLIIQTSEFPRRVDCDTCFKSTSAGGDTIRILRSDQRWPIGSPAFFYIGVRAATVAQFNFIAFASTGRVQLYDGEPQSAAANGGKITYFEYNLEGDSNFTIALSPASGDPDVVVSVTDPNPTGSSYTWKAERWGFDVVRINNNDPSYVPNTKYNIGVYGFPDTTFSITAAKMLTYTILPEGTPLVQTVGAKDYRYFKFTLLQSYDLLITVTPLSSFSDPDIYVTYNRERPSRTDYDYRSSGVGSDTVNVAGARPGTYYVAIYGYSASDFQISATTEYKTNQLTEGIEWRTSSTAGKYTYFKFYQGDEQSGVTFDLNAISGDAEVYISLKNSKPTAEPGKFDYKAARAGSRYIAGAPSGHVGNVYAGVYAVTNLTYSIIASSNASYTVLPEGSLSFFNRVPQNYYRYFIYDQMDASQDATIAVSPWSGETSLYVSNINRKPTRFNYTYSSENYKQDSVLIPGEPTMAGMMRRWYIGVYGDQDSTFSINAFMSNSTVVEIKSTYPVSGAVFPGKYNFYKFYNKDVGSITINLELNNADTDADIYASTRITKPSSLDHEYRGEKYGNDFIRIPTASPGWIYISVYGFAGAKISYSLTVSLESIFLSPGRAEILSSAKQGEYKHFKTLAYSYCDFVVISSSTINGRTSLFLNTNDTLVNATNAMAVSSSWPGNVLLVKNTDPIFKSGVWSFSVYGQTNSDFFVSALCGYRFFNSYLTESVARLGAAPAGKTVNYAFSVPSTSDPVAYNYYLYIRPLHGMFDVVVNQGSKVWNVSRVVQNAVITLDKKDLKAGFVYVKIIASTYRNLESIFEITVNRDGAPVYLNQDLPYFQLSTVAEAVTYYRILNSFTRSNMAVFTESCNDNPPPIAYIDPSTENPGEGAPYKTVNGKYTGYTEVKPVENPFIFIGVKGSQYSIFASQRADALPKISDKQLSGEQNNGLLSVLVTPAVPSALSTNLTYYVYAVAVDEAPKDINFDTSCALTYRGKRWINVGTSMKNDKLEIKVVPPEEAKSYRINVLVQDGYGVGSVYQAAWYLDGYIYRDYPNSTVVSIGAILMFTLFLLFMLYMLLGIIINLVRGKRGVEVIPNNSFWTALPFLVWDGIQGVFCCKLCRRDDSGHVALNDDNVDVTAEDTNTTKQSQSYGSV